MKYPRDKSDREWQSVLTPEEFRITRQHGTEPAFSGKYWNSKEPGEYLCSCCGAELFSSDAKYDSGTGWPSFWAPLAAENIGENTDTGHGMRRTEVHCRQCGAHLGHVFPDGPQPTGLRYCINSASLRLKQK